MGNYILVSGEEELMCQILFPGVTEMDDVWCAAPGPSSDLVKNVRNKFSISR